ncbi:extensin family protein [Telmatospirillum sp.]|uniref:extensin family protein n=1 Tax=Telmatospirillum sp. TaxID=2079197 RepID=UPI00283AE0E3|nr:extensin family protein [Telmatospirillum sp.]MDR3436989.1 extensin family protein [Telmatospirillum sp.]
MRLLMIGLGACGLAACTSARPSSPPPSLDQAAVCLKTLDQRHIIYERVKDWKTPEGCGITQAVRVQHSAIDWNRATLLSCPMEETVWDFETKVVQPAAARNFGQTVRKMSNAGSYNCRGEIGGRPERMSQHAYGKAIDITGFELADGTVISVRRDWRVPGAKSTFLHEVAQGACKVFAVVLTPNHNAEHHDHLHLDIGPHKLCGY